MNELSKHMPELPPAALTSDQSLWKISAWSGEFVDRQAEHEYLHKHSQLIARQLLTALAIWAILMLLFAIPDYHALGPTPAFWESLAMRGVTCLLIGVLALLVARSPIRATEARWITMLELIAISLFMGVYQLRPEIVAWIVTLTLIMLISLFIFLPNRVPAVLGVALYMAVATVVAVHLVSPRSPGEMAALSLLLLVPIGIGWAAALRTQILQRKQYALWRQAQQANEALSREMDERARLQEALVKQATTDPLTGLNNRRQYETLFATELAVPSARATRWRCASSTWITSSRSTIHGVIQRGPGASGCRAALSRQLPRCRHPRPPRWRGVCRTASRH